MTLAELADLFEDSECATLGWNTQQHKDKMHSIENNPPPPRCGGLSNALMLGTQGMSITDATSALHKSWNGESDMFSGSTWDEIDSFLNENGENFSNEKPAVVNKIQPTLLSTPDITSIKTPIPVGRKIIKVHRINPSNGRITTKVQQNGNGLLNIKIPVSRVLNTSVDDLRKTPEWHTAVDTSNMSSTSLAALNGRYPGVVDELSSVMPNNNQNSSPQHQQQNGFSTLDVPLTAASTYQAQQTTNYGSSPSVASPLYTSRCGSDVDHVSLPDPDTSSLHGTQMNTNDFLPVSMRDVLPVNQDPTPVPRNIYRPMTTHTSTQQTCYSPQQTSSSPSHVNSPQKPTYVSDHIQSVSQLLHSPTSSAPTTQYGSNGYSTPSPNHVPQEAQHQQYSTIDLTALSNTSPVRHDDDVPSTSYHGTSPAYSTSSSPAPSSPMSGTSMASSPMPCSRKRGSTNNEACRDSRKKKKVKREELKDREMELIADNEVQKKKIAKLEVEVAKTRDVILRMMAGGAAAAAAARR